MGFGRHKDLARRPWRLSAKLLIVSSVATVIGFSAICASVMLDMRRGEEGLARQTLENLASGIDADINRNVELYDLSLRAVASNMVMPELKDVSKTDPASDPVRSCRDREAFRGDPGVRRRRPADHRRRDAGSGPRESRRRGILPGASRRPRFGPVHQPPDAASRRLCHRAQPAHHRRRRKLPRRGRGLDPLQLFPRFVRPPAASARTTPSRF